MRVKNKSIGLEKIVIEGNEYYQCVILNWKDTGKKMTGDLFTNWKDIEYQKAKLLLENSN